MSVTSPLPALTPARLGRAARTVELALATTVLLIAAAWALWPGLLATHDPFATATAERLLPPSAEHLFGTDSLGRDVFARVVHGTSLSLSSAFLAVAIAVLVGAGLGIVAGFVGGILDNVVMRVVEVLMAIPNLLLSMALITALGFGTYNIAVAVGVSALASFARLARGEVVRWRSREFVESSRMAGLRGPALLWSHVLPHASPAVVALLAPEFGGAILAISALSFLGYGAAPPTPEWGLLIAEGKDFLGFAWWVGILPGLVVIIFILAINSLARQARRRKR